MKRTGTNVGLRLYAALFKDIAAWDCGLQESLSADFERMEKTVTTRGLPFLMIDMPEACKIVDKGLSSGQIDAQALPKTFGKVLCKGSREFLSSLFLYLFDSRGRALDGAEPTAVFFLRQTLLLAKKVKEDCSDAAIHTEVDQFRSLDQSLRTPSLFWDCDDLGYDRDRRLSFKDGHRGSPDWFSPRDPVPERLLGLLDRVCDRILGSYRTLDWRDIVPSHGPGSVADAGSGTDKYLFPHWPLKLEGVFPYSYFGQCREDLHLDVDTQTSLHEPPARLLAVPKTLKGPRMIASEPISHQFLQLGLMKWFRKNLPFPLGTCIDFLDQRKSRDLCLEASASGRLATVDLSAASDRLSCWVVERAFRSHEGILRALHASRTRWLVNATGIGEDYRIKLRKFAPMGSGVTFPVQSMIYACVAIAALLWERNAPLTKRTLKAAARDIRVFGDDIIMPSYAVPTLAHLLAHLELKVNASKTHWAGHFRESCGMDAYAGEDVTPLYLRSLSLGETAEDLVSWVDVCNNAYSKGLWALSDAMVRCIPDKVRKLIPVSSDVLGCLTLQCFQAIPPSGDELKRLRLGKMRESRTLHRWEVLGLTPQVKPVRGQRENHQNLLQYFVEDPSPETNWSAGWLVRKRFHLRKRWVESYGTRWGLPG